MSLHSFELPTPARSLGALSIALASILPVSCIYDADQRCGEHQEYDEELDLCVCTSGRVPTEDGCEREPEPEPEPEEETEEEEEPAGDGGAEPSEDDEEEPEDEGPEGLGMSCSSDDDCAGSDATYCDTFVTMGCLVAGCDIDEQDCVPGYECQDLSAFGGPGAVCVAAVCELDDASSCPDGFTCCPAPSAGFPDVCRSGGC